MRLLLFIIVLLCAFQTHAQQGFAFTRITTDDGMGLESNVVTSLHQDQKGYIWVGTANGLQRFDGSKFIQVTTTKPGSDPIPQSTVSQIVSADSGCIIISMLTIREFGIFNPTTFTYHKLAFHLSKPLPPRAEFRMWNDSKGDVYINVLRYGMLRYDRARRAFYDGNFFGIPKGWTVSMSGAFEDVKKQQYWFACDSGLCIYDKPTRQTFTRNNNPRNLPILTNKLLQERLTEVFIDQQRRIWIFCWPLWGTGGQYKLCLDPSGSRFLPADTLGLSTGPIGYTEYRNFFETHEGDLWIYGLGVLFSYDRLNNRFHYSRSQPGSENISISYEVVFSMIEDRDGNIWIATDQGLYFTAHGSGNFSVVNLKFNNSTESTSITDILEMPNGDFWFSSWGTGIKTIDRMFNKSVNYVYKNPPPASWTPFNRNAAKLPWSMCRETATGQVWIGCNAGILMVHDPQQKHTEYYDLDIVGHSTIRYIAEDHQGAIWLGTQAGSLIRYRDGKFETIMEIGTIIYKIFFDSKGWLWLATHEKGLYAIDPLNGKVLQHYSSDSGSSRLFSNTGEDIEELNDSTIVFGAGALNFINKKTRKVTLLTYEDGLSSNTVKRLRTDKNGFIWIVTASGLSRYNPRNNRITPYGRKDGIVLGEQASAADFRCSNDFLIFGGSNAVVMFNPDVFLSTKAPPDVVITDFKLGNNYLPVDSLMNAAEIRLLPDHNSFSLYFATLSYMQRDKLTYYYKMEGIDDEWIKADQSYSVNYSLLPPGKYTFKIYCENLEGLRSINTTAISIFIKPPFWRTWWFYASLLFMVALIVYAVHNMRVNKLLAVEKLRSRVARDLHDDMGSTLSTINILSSMAKTKMNTDAIKTTEYLSKISDNSQRMMEAMDDIVWSIKPTNDSMQKIIARMREFATSVLEAKDMELSFSADEDVFELKLNMEARRDFFLVFKEAINNAAKYSKAQRVSVSLTTKAKKLTLLVHDNGVGFNLTNADSGNGLGNMRKRAENMKGSITIDSKPGEGTRVNVSLFAE